RAGPSTACARVLEEGDVGAGAARLVRVEQVVHRGVGLVDGLLDHSQAEHAGIEVDVAWGIAGDAGHVMDAFEAHGLSSPKSSRPSVRLAARNSPPPRYLLSQVV